MYKCMYFIKNKLDNNFPQRKKNITTTIMLVWPQRQTAAHQR
jgi:hypothetical protein